MFVVNGYDVSISDNLDHFTIDIGFAFNYKSAVVDKRRPTMILDDIKPIEDIKPTYVDKIVHKKITINFSVGFVWSVAEPIDMLIEAFAERIQLEIHGMTGYRPELESIRRAIWRTHHIPDAVAWLREQIAEGNGGNSTKPIDPMIEIVAKMPGAKEPARCPHLEKGKVKICGKYGKMSDIVMHLNDVHVWPINAIADWMDKWADSNGVDISFPVPEKV